MDFVEKLRRMHLQRRNAMDIGLRGRNSGQSTVEFMLMIPILFAMLFFVIEMGLYFSAAHYGTYTAFATARSTEVGYSALYPDEKAVSDLILTGALWQTADTRVTEEMDNGQAIGISVKLNNFEQLVPFPFIKELLPDVHFDTKVYLGPNECTYEYAVDPVRDPKFYDNNIPQSACL